MVRMTKMKKLLLAGVMVTSSLMGSESWGVFTTEETKTAKDLFTNSLTKQKINIPADAVRLEAFLSALLRGKDGYAATLPQNATPATKGIHAFAESGKRDFEDAPFIKTLLQATELGILKIVPDPWFKGTTKRLKAHVLQGLDGLFQKQETHKSKNKEKIFPKDLTLLAVLLQKNLSLENNKVIFQNDPGSSPTQAPHLTQWATEMGIIGANVSDDKPLQERLLSLCTQHYFNHLSSKEEFAKPEYLVSLVAYGDALTSWFTRPTPHTRTQEGTAQESPSQVPDQPNTEAPEETEQEALSQVPNHFNFNKTFMTFVWSQLYPQEPTDAAPAKDQKNNNFVSLAKLTLSHDSQFLKTYTPQAFHQWVGESILQNNHAIQQRGGSLEQTLLGSVIKDQKNNDGTPYNSEQLRALYTEKLNLCKVLASPRKS